jgi:hypothetical protein
MIRSQNIRRSDSFASYNINGACQDIINIIRNNDIAVSCAGISNDKAYLTVRKCIHGKLEMCQVIVPNDFVNFYEPVRFSTLSITLQNLIIRLAPIEMNMRDGMQ